MEELLAMLRALGVRVRGEQTTRMERIGAEAMDLMWEEGRTVRASLEVVRYQAPALDEPGEDNELVFERLVIERYRREEL